MSYKLIIIIAIIIIICALLYKYYLKQYERFGFINWQNTLNKHLSEAFARFS